MRRGLVEVWRTIVFNLRQLERRTKTLVRYKSTRARSEISLAWERFGALSDALWPFPSKQSETRRQMFSFGGIVDSRKGTEERGREHGPPEDDSRVTLFFSSSSATETSHDIISLPLNSSRQLLPSKRAFEGACEQVRARWSNQVKQKLENAG